MISALLAPATAPSVTYPLSVCSLKEVLSNRRDTIIRIGGVSMNWRFYYLTTLLSLVKKERYLIGGQYEKHASLLSSTILVLMEFSSNVQPYFTS